MRERTYFVYILTNASHSALYTGVTGNLERRLYEHRHALTPGFASRYRCSKLVWFETAASAEAAITREKQIKAGSRAKKVALIEAVNPHWAELSPAE